MNRLGQNQKLTNISKKEFENQEFFVQFKNEIEKYLNELDYKDEIET